MKNMVKNENVLMNPCSEPLWGGELKKPPCMWQHIMDNLTVIIPSFQSLKHGTVGLMAQCEKQAKVIYSTQIPFGHFLNF